MTANPSSKLRGEVTRTPVQYSIIFETNFAGSFECSETSKSNMLAEGALASVGTSSA